MMRDTPTRLIEPSISLTGKSWKPVWRQWSNCGGESMRGLVKVFLSFALVATSPWVMSGEGRVVQLPAFHSVEVPDGGHVVIRHGAAQRVTLVRGNLDYTKMRVTADGVLVISNCRHECRGYRSDVEIEMPGITRL